MKYETKPLPASFIKRPNRFLGIVDLDGQIVECHIPNPGRMNELLYKGADVHVIRKQGSWRKTGYDLTLVEYDDIIVSIDSRMPNQLIREAIESNTLPEFKGYAVEKMEPRFDDSRFDLLLTNEDKQILVEAKSCTLVEDQIALFPDAPTKRGARHMRTLIKALEYGRSVVVFVIQRNDAREFRANVEMDPEFTESLKQALENGVEIYAYLSDVTLKGITLQRKIPVALPMGL